MAKTEVHLKRKTDRRTPETVLLDDHGQPLPSRVSRVLQRLAPSLARQFSALREEHLLVDALEQAGARILRRESRNGPVTNLEAYAWITLASVANSLLRTGPSRLARKTTSQLSRNVLSVAVATFGSVEQIERAILIRELLECLTPTERLIVEWRLEGLTSQEIAQRRGCTVVAVDILLTRARRRLRSLLGSAPAAPYSERPSRRSSSTQRRRQADDHGVPVALLTPLSDHATVLEL